MSKYRSKSEVLQDAIDDINYMIVNDELLDGEDGEEAIQVLSKAIDQWEELMLTIYKERKRDLEFAKRHELETAEY